MIGTCWAGLGEGGGTAECGGSQLTVALLPLGACSCWGCLVTQASSEKVMPRADNESLAAVAHLVTAKRVGFCFCKAIAGGSLVARSMRYQG